MNTKNDAVAVADAPARVGWGLRVRGSAVLEAGKPKVFPTAEDALSHFLGEYADDHEVEPSEVVIHVIGDDPILVGTVLCDQFRLTKKK